MALFGNKDKEEAVVKMEDSPPYEAKATAPVSPAVKGVKVRSIPANVAVHFNDEEKRLYAKDVKTLTKEEAKKLAEVKVKIARMQGRLIVKRIEDRERVNPKLVSYAKCVFAEEILALEPELLKKIQGKEYSKPAAVGLEALAKLHNMDLQFKVKPKA